VPIRLVIPLRDCRGDDVPLVGGKAANLGELVHAGLPVPDGFVVTVDAYAAAATAIDVDAQAEALLSPDAGTRDTAAAGLRAAFERAEIPDAVRSGILDGLDRLGEGAVAVRSSATAEDLPGATFAGQQDTFLGIRGAEEVVDAVRRCWASLWTDRAVAYRARLGVRPERIGIAVVVQRLVPAEVAGVMFTADPVTGERDGFVVDASPGLGEAVVSGEVTPDHFALGRDGSVRSWRPGRREVVIAADGTRREREPGASASPDGAHRAGDAAGSGIDGGAPVLTEAETRRLAALGARVEAHFGRPQDIEWAQADGRAWIVQARPMTALPLPPQRLHGIQRLASTVIGDYVTARPYPLDMSTWVPRGPVGMMARITADVGVRGMFDRLFREEDGVVVGATVPDPRPAPRLLTAPIRLGARALRYRLRDWRGDPRARAARRRLEAIADVDARSLEWGELLRMPGRALDAVPPVTALRSAYLPSAGLAIARLALLLTLLRRRDALMDLLQGAPTLTSAANDGLLALARLANADERTAAAVRQDDLEGALREPAFARAFEEWRREHGSRETTSPILVTTPTLGESPEAVLTLVRLLLDAEGADADADAAEGAAAHAAAEADAADAASKAGAVGGAGAGAGAHGRSGNGRADEALRDLLARAPRPIRGLLRHAVESARAGVAFREDTHALFMRPLGPLRRSLLEIGRRLAEAGALASPEDVFHLRLEELEALDSPGGARARELAGVVAGRAARRAALAGVPLLNIARDEPDARRSGRSRGAGGSAAAGRGLDGPEPLVIGIPGGGGAVVGRVRVIRSVGDFGRLRHGEVLVCPYTNPSWTPLFQLAAAVVVDSGGPGSHAAIVAREYGLPGVFGTGDATRTLHDGDLVRVDGTAGTVSNAAEAGEAHASAAPASGSTAPDARAGA